MATHVGALRSCYDYYNPALHDGRIGYAADRSDGRVWTANGAYSRTWQIEITRADPANPGSQEIWLLWALDTQRSNPPPGPGDFFMTWAYMPLLLTAPPGGPVRLGAIGLDLDEMNAHWVPDYRTIPNPDDPTRTLDVVRLQSRLNPGWFLCHDRYNGPIPGTDIPIVTSALTLKNTEDPQTGGIDLDWAMEFTSAPAAAGLAKATAA